MSEDALPPDPGALRLRLGIATDLHLTDPRAPAGRWIYPQLLGQSRELACQAVATLAAESPAAIALLGDLTDQGEPEQFRYLHRQAAATGIPTFLVTGNHDLHHARDPVADLLSAHPYGQIRQPAQEGTDIGGFRVAGGHIEYTGHEWDCRLTSLPDSRTWPAGEPLVWLTHHPLLSLREQAERRGVPYSGDLANASDVLNCLRAHNGPVIILAGHLHIRGHAQDASVLQLCHAATVERPHEVAIVDIRWHPVRREAHVTRRCLTLDIPGQPVMQRSDSLLSVHDPATVSWHWREQTWKPAAAEIPAPKRAIEQ
jgi:hypothetical protein